MKIGWVGLGKLGLPCALALEQHGGHQIIGYDTNPRVAEIMAGDTRPPSVERGLAELVDGSTLKLAAEVDEVVAGTDGLVFVAVQTPHAPAYGGTTPAPDTPRDFDYGALQAAVAAITLAATDQEKDITLVIVSTVLPGTIDRHIRPLLGDHTKILYNPFFIAMGTTIRDFLQPEFVLIGTDNGPDAAQLVSAYATVHQRPVHVMGIVAAELTKVVYNTYISMKIVFANTVMEIAHKLGVDCDEVTDTLQAAHERIISGAYIRGGMGDGGACHPRDGIAMTYLANELDLSTDPFAYLTRAREAQTAWLADLVRHYHDAFGLPIIILGKSYKPCSNLTEGSPALLLSWFLARSGIAAEHYDPYVNDGTPKPDNTAAALYVIATRHPDFRRWDFPDGSVIIDPWRYVMVSDRYTVIPIGGSR